jgi:O-antigen/teichoic acid export membrane protein
VSIGRKIAWNTIVQLVGKVITTVISLVIVALITRRLGVATFGDYTTILAYSQLFAVFADLGVNVYLIKLLSQPGVDETEEVGVAFTLRLLSAAGVLLLGYFLTYFLPYTPLVRLGIAIALIAIFAQTVNALFVSVLQAKLEMHYAVITDVLGRLTVLLVTLVALSFNRGVLWVVGGVTVGALLNVFLSYLFANKFIRLKNRWSPEAMRRILQAALPISITAILSFLYFKVDTVLLSTLSLSGGRTNATEVGIYGSAYKVLELLTVVPGIFVGNLFPVITRYLATQDDRLPLLLQRAFVFLAAFSFPITALLVLEPEKVIGFIAGQGFLAAAAPLRILAFAVLINFFSTVFTYTVLALSRQKALVVAYSVALVFNLAANILFIPRYSYIAAAYTTFLTEIIVLIGSYWICHRHIQLRLDWVPLFKLFGITAILIGVMVALPGLSFLPLLVILVALYILLILFTRVITLADLRRLVVRD